MTLLVVGIDACRCKSGGALAHMRGLLENLERVNENGNGIHVHIWSYPDLLEQIKPSPFLTKHYSKTFGLGTLGSLIWQRFFLSKEFKQANCDILFTADSSSLCPIRPSVALSQDALSFEPGTISRFLFSTSIVRMLLIFQLQKRYLSKSQANIFLTGYAQELIERQLKNTPRSKVIYHGIDSHFLNSNERWQLSVGGRPLKCVYVSNYSLYKNQWNVVGALNYLGTEDVQLTLIGGGTGKAKALTYRAIEGLGNKANVRDLGRVEHDDLPRQIVSHDLFVFASSCETISITFLEAMALGMPVVSSNIGPMKEVLGCKGIYFDPNEPADIARAIKEYMKLSDFEKSQYSNYVRSRVAHYTWYKCSKDTFTFIKDVHDNYYFRSGRD